MANSSVCDLIRPLLLFVFLLHASNISALDCYRCATVPDKPVLDNNSCLTDKLVYQTEPVLDQNATEFGHFKQFQENLIKSLTEANINFTKDPSCFTFTSFANDTKDLLVIRYEVPETPEILTEPKCVNYTHPSFGSGQTCFCQMDKCNSDSELNNNGVWPLVPNPTTQTTTNTSMMKPLNSKNSTSGVSRTLRSVFLTTSFIMLITGFPASTPEH